MSEVRVDLPNGRYTIYIEPTGIDRLGVLVKQLKLADRALVVTDDHVGALYGRQVLRSLGEAGIEAELESVLPGEGAKDLTVAMKLYTKAIAMELDRKSPIIALGGGVVGDLAGFVAATYMRGVPFIQVPTSLLAQVDSSVGGKVAVNHPMGKNLIGAFYQPRLVIADTGVLKTLPARELATGLAEVAKHAIIAAPDFLQYLEDNHRGILAQDPEAMTKIIQRSCEIKASVVEQDEKETHLRMMLNFGHTIAHGVEASRGYGVYTHGEAVAIGMHGAALISRYLGLCSSDTVEAVQSILRRFNLPLTAKDCQPDELLSFFARDKKRIDGAINWVLIKAIGQVVISNQVPEDIIRTVLGEIT
ncbi:MAG: 3-dehydroquinate synthase [Negativicutes bacterium]|nr:3-dehydroquinate synthase [Negativicutes bacterium]